MIAKINFANMYSKILVIACAIMASLVLVSSDHYSVVSSIHSQVLDGHFQLVLDRSQSSNISFNVEGTINTVITAFPSEKRDRPSSLDHITNVSSEYVLGGKWRLDIINNNVTYFKSNFTMVGINGDEPHFHLFIYKPRTKEISIMFSNGSDNPGLLLHGLDKTVSFSGNCDIITNGVLEWRDVPMSVSILNDKVIKISVDEKRTNNHFSKNSIFGLVNLIEPIIQNLSDTN